MSNITTYTNKDFNPLNPDKDSLDILDIAHSLSFLCRGNGHFYHFYSVAQHCINCAAEAKASGFSRKIQLACLLHDAGESYLADIPRPVKKQMDGYCESEDKLLHLIWDKWLDEPLTAEEKKVVFDIDDSMLKSEFLHFMNRDIIIAKELVSTPDFVFSSFEAIQNTYLQLFYTLTNTSDCFSYIGIDWFKGKWIAVILKNETTEIKLLSDISQIESISDRNSRTLVDIPIGLPDTKEELFIRPDAEARNFLKNSARKSSVFNVPVRSAVYAENKDAAQKLNVAVSGKKLSSQSISIIPIIRQVDSFLQNNPKWKNVLRESHPELAFQVLNNNEPLDYSKHTIQGLQYRIEIIRKYYPNVDNLLSGTPANMTEDILDAMCLAITARQIQRYGEMTIPQNPQKDKTGLNMHIVLSKG